MKIRKTIFLTDDENKDVNEFVNELIKENKGESEFIESGGLKVEVEIKPKKKGEEWLFSLYKQIGFVKVK